MIIPIIVPGHILRSAPVTDDGAIVPERSRNRHPRGAPCVIRRAVKRVAPGLAALTEGALLWGSPSGWSRGGRRICARSLGGDDGDR